MSTDHELLKLAAKAAGVDADWQINFGPTSSEHFTTDKAAATRRAIVRVAAQIGRTNEN